MALKSQGVTIGIESATPDSYDLIGQVNSITGIGSGTAAEIDVTNLSSTAKEFLIGLPDEGSVTFGGYLDPDDTTGQVAVRAARSAGTLESFQVTLTDAGGTTVTFDGYVMQFSTDINQDAAVTFSSTIRITGAAVWA